MKKMLIAAVLLVFLALVGIQVYRLYGQRNNLKNELSGINPRITSLEQENKNLQKDLEYFANPENLLKELRARFNYKKPDEKMIIVVPPRNQSTTE